MQRKSLHHSLLAAGSLGLLLGLTPHAHAQNTIVYANEDNFTGYGITGGGATTASKVTRMVADDINTVAGSGGMGVVSLDFSIANLNTATVTVFPTLDFYDTSGANGGPGALLASIPLNSIAAPAGVGLYTFAPTSGSAFVIPASGSFWAGETFTSTTATAAQLNKFGQGTFNPPTYGTSADENFVTTNTGTFGASNPVGTVQVAPYEPTVYASLGWEFETATPAAAPEPSQFAALAIGGLGIGMLALRRRRTA